MLNKLLWITILLVVFSTAYAKAESARDLHDISHLAVGYTANTLAYPVLRALGLEKSDALAWAFVGVAAAAAGKELFIDRRGSVRDAGLGIVGAGASFVTIIAIEVQE